MKGGDEAGSILRCPHAAVVRRAVEPTSLAALYAATSLIITVHPAMLDVASCNQFLS